MPTYEPDVWNGGAKQRSRNCYDYALDRRPGQGVKTSRNPGGGDNRTDWTCDAAAMGARSDGVYIRAATDDAEPEFKTFEECQAKGGEGSDCWRVALFVSESVPGVPGRGYHWVREDKKGMWSHKPSVHGRVTDRAWKEGEPPPNGDYEGNPITDPETADLRWFYDVKYRFCRYGCVCRGRQKSKDWYAGLPSFDGPAFAIVNLNQPARLVGACLELELPLGRLAVVYDRPSVPALEAELLLSGGPGNPAMTLDEYESRELGRRLDGLSPTTPPDRYPGLGFLVSNPSAVQGLPRFLYVGSGLVDLVAENNDWRTDDTRLYHFLTERFLRRGEETLAPDVYLAVARALGRSR